MRIVIICPYIRRPHALHRNARPLTAPGRHAACRYGVAGRVGRGSGLGAATAGPRAVAPCTRHRGRVTGASGGRLGPDAPGPRAPGHARGAAADGGPAVGTARADTAAVAAATCAAARDAAARTRAPHCHPAGPRAGTGGLRGPAPGADRTRSGRCCRGGARTTGTARPHGTRRRTQDRARHRRDLAAAACAGVPGAVAAPRRRRAGCWCAC